MDPTTAGADVYLALGQHGLARVRLTPANFTGTAPTVEWGPVWGNSTWQADPLRDPFGFHNNFDFVNENTGAIEGSARPVFTDVVVQVNGSSHRVYATVDNLGWVRYVVSPSLPWSDQTPEDHHEGALYYVDKPVYDSDKMLLLTTTNDDTATAFTWPRRLDVVQQGTGWYLVVAAGNDSIVRDNWNRQEGAVLDSNAEPYNGISIDAATWIAGPHGHTLIWDLAAIPPSSSHTLNVAARKVIDHSGGRELAVPSQQNTSGVIRYFGGTGLQREGLQALMPPNDEESNDSNITFKNSASLSTGQVSQLTRNREDRPGRNGHAIGYSFMNPDVFTMGSNDFNPAPDGIYVQCGSSIDTQYKYAANADRADLGLLFNPDGQWDSSTAGNQYLAGVKGNDAAHPDGPYFRTVDFHPGTQPCGGPDIPVAGKRAYILPAPDRFGLTGRWFNNFSLSAAYDVDHIFTDPSEEYAFGNMAGVEGGTLVFRRDKIQAILENGSWSDEQEYKLGLGHMPGAFQAAFRTHPEFENVPVVGGGADFMKKHYGTFTGMGHLFRLRGPGSSSIDTWVYGVPCFHFEVDPTDPEFIPHANDWAPDNSSHLSNFSHLFVRFWNIQNPGLLIQTNTGNETQAVDTDLVDIIGPDPKTSAREIRVVERQDKVYCFIADFGGGSVRAYEVTDLLQTGGGPAPGGVWQAPSSLTDDFINGVSSIAVDRAQWTSGGVNYDELFVYACVNRVGIQVLRYCTVHGVFHPVKLIQTPGYTENVLIRKYSSGVRNLLLADGWGGIRVYRYDF